MVVSLLGAVCLTAGVVLLRANRSGERRDVREEAKAVPPGESVPGSIVLDRLRELGI